MDGETLEEISAGRDLKMDQMAQLHNSLVGHNGLFSSVQNNVTVKTEVSGVDGGSKLDQDAQYPPIVMPSDLVSRVCVVCCDRASGKHYGVYSCEGCKVRHTFYLIVGALIVILNMFFV